MIYTGKAILPFFGAHQPTLIDKAMCLDYAAQRTAAGIKPGSIWTELGHLQSALNFALKSKAPKIHRPRKPEPDMRILTAGEKRALVEAAHDPHIRLAITLLLVTGARAGAILDLTWDRVDLDRGIINLRLNDSTTRKGRAVVPMTDTTKAALIAAHSAALSDYVIEYAGKPVASIRHGFQNAVTRANLGRVTIHELRHTAAVTMLGAGVPIEKVAQVLGHSNLAVTYRTYARFMPEQMQDAVNVLDFTKIRSVK